MAKRTVETGYFGSLGLGDPMSSFAEKNIRVSWDFKKKSVTQKAYQGGAKVIPLMPIPKGLCIDRISIVQTKYMDNALTLTFGMESDDGYTVGGNFALVTSSTMLRSCQAPKAATVTKTANNVYVSTASASWTASDAMKLVTDVSADTSLFVSSDDLLCMIVPEAASGVTAKEFADGAFDVCIHGYETFAEGPAENKTGETNYRKTLQVTENVSGGQFPLD